MSPSSFSVILAPNLLSSEVTAANLSHSLILNLPAFTTSHDPSHKHATSDTTGIISGHCEPSIIVDFKFSGAFPKKPLSLGVILTPILSNISITSLSPWSESNFKSSAITSFESASAQRKNAACE